MATSAQKVKPFTEQLIGTSVKVIDAKNATLTGLEGFVDDETRHTITIHTQRGRTKVLKDQVTLQLGWMHVAGQQLVGRPEERIKKSW